MRHVSILFLAIIFASVFASDEKEDGVLRVTDLPYSKSMGGCSFVQTVKFDSKVFLAVKAHANTRVGDGHNNEWQLLVYPDADPTDDFCSRAVASHTDRNGNHYMPLRMAVGCAFVADANTGYTIKGVYRTPTESSCRGSILELDNADLGGSPMIAARGTDSAVIGVHPGAPIQTLFGGRYMFQRNSFAGWGKISMTIKFPDDSEKLCFQTGIPTPDGHVKYGGSGECLDVAQDSGWNFFMTDGANGDGDSKLSEATLSVPSKIDWENFPNR
jgi:hypothetical protein